MGGARAGEVASGIAVATFDDEPQPDASPEERLADDHSLVEEFVRQGKLTPEEAEVHPQRSIITRALGPEPQVEVDTFTYPARAGDVYLACSDGLTGMISEEQVAEILGGTATLDDAAKALIDAANANGGRDNITVVLFRLDQDP